MQSLNPPRLTVQDHSTPGICTICAYFLFSVLHNTPVEVSLIKVCLVDLLADPVSLYI